MSRRELKVLAVGLAVMAAAGIALFGGFLPGVKPQFGLSGVVRVDGESYYSELTPLKIPLLVNWTTPWNVTFENVTFELWLTNWYSPLGGLVHGTGTEPGGTAYPFVLGVNPTNDSRTILYLSPDGAFGADWAGGAFGGFFVQLLVRT